MYKNVKVFKTIEVFFSKRQSHQYPVNLSSSLTLTLCYCQVLTVAHCWTDNLVAAAGVHTFPEVSRTEQLVKVEAAVSHPEFRKFGPYSNDIALLLLAKPGIQLTEVSKPACLSPRTPSPGTWCEVNHI